MSLGDMLWLTRLLAAVKQWLDSLQPERVTQQTSAPTHPAQVDRRVPAHHVAPIDTRPGHWNWYEGRWNP